MRNSKSLIAIPGILFVFLSLNIAAFADDVFYTVDPPDINDNGQVNFEDLALFVSQWLNTDCCQTDCCSWADLDLNGIVDFFDYAVFADEY